MSKKTEKIKVYGMTCTSCEKTIEKALLKLDGVLSSKAEYADETVEIEYNEEVCSIEKIKNVVNNSGYTTEKPSKDGKVLGIVIIGLAILLLGKYSVGFDMSDKLTNASYVVLFLVGMLTSIHCIGMCGGIMLSQSISKEDALKSKFQSILPSILYNGGRIVSYTILGGIVGAIGSVFSLSLSLKAGLQIFAAVFMIIMGANMAGFSLFRKINIRLPWSSCSLKRKTASPFLVGILNGFMPCGPLQTMQLYALSTGSATKGALSMFIFALGTVPLMLTFGAISGLLSKGYTKKLLKFSGILVIVLGIIMGNRGLALAGINVPSLNSLGTSSSPSGGTVDSTKAIIKDGKQTLTMSANYRGYVSNVLYVQKGIPVNWIINGEEITSCNNAIVVPSLGIEAKIGKGENIIEEFTPTESGDINFSCWMGMIRGVIRVVDDISVVDASKSDSSLPAPSQPSCCSVPLEETESIYGDDISTAPTERLVKKATITSSSQEAIITGIGFEFDPLIMVVNKGIKATINLDLTSFDIPEGTYEVIDGNTGKTLDTFEGKKGIVKVNIDTTSNNVYGVIKNERILGIIEVVDDLNTVNLEEIKIKYLN